MIAKPPTQPDNHPDAEQGIATGTRRFLWIFSIAMVLSAGTAFIFKLIEFLWQFSDSRNKVAAGPGLTHEWWFAIAPLVTYLIVAAGFMCLFLWAYFSGQFRNVEGPKYRMLDMQHEIDQREAELGAGPSGGYR